MELTAYMEKAFAAARKAAALGEVPVGAVVVGPKGDIIATAHNQMRALKDPTAHAEMLAIRAAAAALQTDRLTDCALYVTLEPCAMCAGAIAHARLKRVVFGAYDPKSGGTQNGARVFSHPQCHHKPEVISGIRANEAEDILKQFFAQKRGLRQQ